MGRDSQLWPRTLELEIGDLLQNRTSKEMDRAKLMILVERLCCALEGERRQKAQLAATLQGNDPRSFPGN
jgi:hypothetical protein